MFQNVERLIVLKLQFQWEEINPLAKHSKHTEIYLPPNLFVLPNGLIEKIELKKFTETSKINFVVLCL